MRAIGPIAVTVFAAFALAACPPRDHGHPHDEHGHDRAAHGEHGEAGDHHGHGEGDVEAISVTEFGEHTELFVEFPPFVKGAEATFIAHFTRLDDFLPLAAGRVTVTLEAADGGVESAVSNAPVVPGIFRPSIRPRAAGHGELTITVEADDKRDAFRLGRFEVYESADAARAAAPPEGEGDDGGEIAYLKEQQWQVDFATAFAHKRRLRWTIAANGALHPRADGEALVTAPATGRLLTAGDGFPRIGLQVERGRVLAVLAPRVEGGTDAASLRLAVDRAALRLAQAKRESERLGGLLDKGAVPERRVAEARHEERVAEAELATARRRAAQFERLQAVSGADTEGSLAVRSPISGTIVAVDVVPGGFLEEGREMFHVVDLDRLWLKVQVPEIDVGKIGETVSAWFEVDGFGEIFEVEAADRASALGAVVDPETRTVPLILGFDNPRRRLPIGAYARAHVVVDEPFEAVAVPAGAVVDDGGQLVVYVMRGGESFERRIVEIGIRDREYVEIRRGLEAGERVVTKGGYAVKLASSAPAAVGHGHAH